jgi:spore coat polysaccharide biosynthesis protein SpsF
VIDDAIEQLVQQMSLECVRGSETDVLGRFMQALEQFPSQAVVRVCADNPLTDPEQVDALVKFFWDKGCDYAYNNRPECGLPDGVGAEVVLADALRRVDQEATLAKYREHVTLYIIDHPDLFRIAQLKAPKHLWFPDIRLDVDYQEDLNFLQRLCELLPADLAPFWTVADIIKVVKGMPDILKLRHERD